MKNKLEILKKVFYIAFVVFIVTTTLLALMTLKGAPNNLRLFIVSSGSMEPSIKTGAVVFVKGQSEYKVGDIITFYRELSQRKSDTATHRIIEIKVHEITKETTFITKGDANEDPDIQPLDPKQVLGKVVFSIPFFGSIIAFVKTQLGFTLLIVIPTIILIYNEFLNIKKEVSKLLEKRKEKNEA